ncbi:MAG: hypothetical protein AAGD00_02315 [Planctomycetota bacterium]
MNDAGRGYKREVLQDGVRYELPIVMPGRSIVGCLSVFFGFPFLGGAIGASLALFGAISGGPQGVAAVIGTVAFTLAFGAIGLFAMAIGLMAFVGRSEVEVNRHGLRPSLVMPGVRLGKTLAYDEIEAFVVRARVALRETAGTGVTDAVPAGMSQELVMRLTNGTYKRLCGHRTRAWLEGFAHELAQQASVYEPSELSGERKIPVEVAEPMAVKHQEPLPAAEAQAGTPGASAIASSKAGEGDLAPLPEAPKKATAIVTRNGDTLSIRLPPKGFGGSKGMVGFAVIFNGVLLFIGFIFSQTFFSNSTPTFAMIFAGVIFGGFLLLGLGLLLSAINQSVRRGVIDVIGPPGPDAGLLITQKGLFGVTSRQWLAQDLAGVVCGFSGTTINDKPVNNLRVRTIGGDETGFFTERDDNELRWIAGLIAGGLELRA